MEIYTPGFNKIKKLLFNKIIEYIGSNIIVKSNEINEYIENLKKRNEKDFQLIDFTFSYPYSDQVQEVLVDMIRRCIVKQTDEGYCLTSYGLSLIGNDI